MPTEPKPHADTTQDYFYKKKVKILQHKNGYRFSVDAPILADFLPFHPTETAAEIGTGCGIISMSALYKNKFARVLGFEIQPALGRLAEINAEENGFQERFQWVPGDFSETFRDAEGIDILFSNPPYYPLRVGRLSPNPEVRDAKFETRLTLRKLLETSRQILTQNGDLYLVLPYRRRDELMDLAPRIGLFPRRTRKVFSFKDGNPERFLVQLSPCTVSKDNEKMTPLIIFKEKGIYTEEMEKILSGSS